MTTHPARLALVLSFSPLFVGCAGSTGAPDAALPSTVDAFASAVDASSGRDALVVDALFESDAFFEDDAHEGDAYTIPDAYVPPDAFACGAGTHECDGRCVPEREACGVALPDACTTRADCGAAGECVSRRCVCVDGYRTCTAGCCPTSYTTEEYADVHGRRVMLDHSADGTAFVLVYEEVSTSYCLLWLYARPPGGVLARTALGMTVDCGHSADRFDLAVRADGTVLVAVAPTFDSVNDVRLYTWRTGDAIASVRLGSSARYGGIGIALDADETAWVSWARTSGGIASAEVTIAGEVTTSTPSGATGDVAQTDTEYDPVRDAVDAYWAHYYTGSFRGGSVPLDGASPISYACPADDAAYASTGRSFSIHNTYPEIDTVVCTSPGGSGETASTAYARVAGPSLPRVLAGSALAIDAEDVAFISYYDTFANRGSWIATNDADRFSRGGLPAFYDEGSATTDADLSPAGRMVMVVLPREAAMGPLRLITLE